MSNQIRKMWTYLPVLVIVAIAVAKIIISDGYVHFEDDAFYYFLVARNIVEIGESSVLAGYPTNGYHPLWLLVLTAFGAVFGFDLFAIRVFEIVLLAAGTALAIWAVRPKSVVVALFVALGMYVIVARVGMFGMETSLLFPALAAFLGLCLRDTTFTTPSGAVLLFLAAGAVIGSRLDAALLILPALFLMPLRPDRRVFILAALGVCGAVYVGVNLWLFDTALPVSGDVKSLGSPTLNTKYIDQVTRLFPGLPWVFFNGHSFITPWALWLGLATALVILSMPIGKLRSGMVLSRRLGLALLIGFLLYTAKVMFGSSWRIWAWYGYPSVALAIAIFAIFVNLGDGRAWKVGVSVLGIVAILQQNAGRWFEPLVEENSFAISRIFAEQIRSEIGDAPIVMGDRAGTLAWDLGTGLFQLEGLVNTADYVDLIKGGDVDLRNVLCAEGLRNVVDYEAPLGAYDRHDIEIFRASLTTFRGPTLTVYSDEEVASYSGLGDFDSTTLAETTDTSIYFWRLDCSRD